MVSPNVSRGFGPVTSPASQQQPLAFWTVPNTTTTGAGSLQFVVTTAGPAGDSGLISNGISVPGFASTIGFWGPGRGVSNGFTAPSGAMCGNAPGVLCNYVALDADPENSMIPGFTNSPVRGIITQSISGLTPGDEYELTFDWAGGQLWLSSSTFTGSTSPGLAVSLGSQAQTVSIGGTCPPNTNPSLTTPTPGCGLPNHGFSGWMQENMIFTANATNEVLAFMGAGTPLGLPPIVGVTGIDLQPIPEPATWSLLGIGFAAIAARAYLRRKSAHVPDQAGDVS